MPGESKNGYINNQYSVPQTGITISRLASIVKSQLCRSHSPQY